MTAEAASDRDAGSGAPARSAPRRPFLRSRSHKLIAGICGGLAERLGWAPATVRVGYVLISLIPFLFPGAVVYLVLWLLIPLEPDSESGS